MKIQRAEKIVGVKRASNITGLSEWELRLGVKIGKYPYLRVGSKRGKILFNIDLLNEKIDQIMIENCVK